MMIETEPIFVAVYEDIQKDYPDFNYFEIMTRPRWSLADAKRRLAKQERDNTPAFIIRVAPPLPPAIPKQRKKKGKE